MKKVLILILLMMSVLLTGCFKNKVVPNTNEIHLYLQEEFTKHMPYEEVPSFTFSFNGTFNTLAYVPETYYTLFATNDDVLLSEEIANLIEEYKDTTEFVIEEINPEPTTRINTLGSDGKQIAHKYPVDDSQVIDEVAYISLPNGLKLTLDYRRFVSEGKTYYVWSYKNNLSMHLYYPLMVIKDDDKKEIVLLTLPNRVKYQVSPALKVDNILKKDEYLKDDKYKFAYVDLAESNTPLDKMNYVKNYYIDNHNGYEDNDQFFFTYLNVKFEVKYYEEYFLIKYVEKVS